MKRSSILKLLASLLPLSNAMAADNSVAAREWKTYVDLIAPLGEQTAALIADPQDPQLRQEMYSLLFAGMGLGYTGLFMGDAEHPDLWPVFDKAYNIGVPDPDDVYYMTALDAKGIYKISGFRGTVSNIDFQIGGGLFYARGQGPYGPNFANYDVDTLHINKEDRSFEVILSQERPAGYTGDWWKMHPETMNLLIRQIANDWMEEDGRIAIDRLDRPAIRPRVSAKVIEENLRLVPAWSQNWITLTVQNVRSFREAGLINKVKVFDLSSVGGIKSQQYIQGIFDLQPDEALIYETDMPKCHHWNITLYDMLWSMIDYMNRQTSLNGHYAKMDSDGKFRAVISAVDPGVPNWLDTAGYKEGAILARLKDCNVWPTPTVTKVKVADIRKYLPSDTPVVTAEERDATIRLRRKGAQLRRRW